MFERSPAARILATLPEGSLPALSIGVACIIFLSQTNARNLLSAAAFIAASMVLLVLVRRVASVKDDVATLAMSEARFRSLVQNSSDVILIVEADTTIRYASPSVRSSLQSCTPGTPSSDSCSSRKNRLASVRSSGCTWLMSFVPTRSRACRPRTFRADGLA